MIIGQIESKQLVQASNVKIDEPVVQPGSCELGSPGIVATRLRVS